MLLRHLGHLARADRVDGVRWLVAVLPAGSVVPKPRNARVSQKSLLKQHRTSSKARSCDGVASPARPTSFKLDAPFGRVYPHVASPRETKKNTKQSQLPVSREPFERPTDLSLGQNPDALWFFWHRPFKRRCHGPPDLLGPSGCCVHCSYVVEQAFWL